MEGERLIAKVLKLARDKGINQSELSRQIQVHPSRFSEWKSGNSRPSLTQVLNMARTLDVSVDYLVKDEIEEAPNASGFSHNEEAIITLVRAMKLSLSEALRRLATPPGSSHPVATSKEHSTSRSPLGDEVEQSVKSPHGDMSKPGCLFAFEGFVLLGIDEIPEGSVVCKAKQVVHQFKVEPGREYPIHGDFELYTPPPSSMLAFVARFIPQGLTFTPTFGSIIYAKDDISITEHNSLDYRLGGPMIYAVLYKDWFVQKQTEDDKRRKLEAAKMKKPKPDETK